MKQIPPWWQIRKWNQYLTYISCFFTEKSTVHIKMFIHHSRYNINLALFVNLSRQTERDLIRKKPRAMSFCVSFPLMYRLPLSHGMKMASEKSLYILEGWDGLICMGLTFSPSVHGLTLINESIISIPVFWTVKACWLRCMSILPASILKRGTGGNIPALWEMRFVAG